MENLPECQEPIPCLNLTMKTLLFSQEFFHHSIEVAAPLMHEKVQHHSGILNTLIKKFFFLIVKIRASTAMSIAVLKFFNDFH
jgi:hypothetical protein